MQTELTKDSVEYTGSVKPPDISVVILNYNVREFLENCLNSVRKAIGSLSVEVFVVDNASVDDSPRMVQEKFPEVTLIENEDNVGFARGNNIALRNCRGRYVLVLNPDTLLQEDTLSKMIVFMDAHPEAGAASCKVLNADGTLQLTCKRSFPTPWVAFTKITGLSKLFPQSKLFGRYNLTYLDENETHEVEAIAGSFMFLRREILDSVGMLDETYFMYGEDLDWCYRIWKSGWKIYYVPTTQIIHYKGESTSRSGFVDIKTFYEAMEIFVEKHFKKRYSIGMILFLKLAIWIRAFLARLHRLFRLGWAPIIDLVFINLSVSLGILLRYHDFITPPWIESSLFFYVTLHTVSSLIWLVTLYFLDNYGKRQLSLSQSLMASVIGFFILSTVTLFSKEFVFSRLYVIYTSGLVLVFLVTWRVLGLFLMKKGARKNLWAVKVFKKHTLIVGTVHEARMLYRKIQKRFDSPYHVLGYVSTQAHAVDETVESDIRLLGPMTELPSIIRKHQIAEVLIAAEELPHAAILSMVRGFAGMPVNVRLVPSGGEIIIGKSEISRLESLPILAMESELDKPFNRFFKRMLDIILCTAGFFVTGLIWIGLRLRRRVTPETAVFTDRFGNRISVRIWVNSGNRRLTAWSYLYLVLTNRLSLVGTRFRYPPGDQNKKTEKTAFLSHRPGVFSLADLFMDSASADADDESVRNYDNYYLRNYSIKMDLEILLRGLLKL